MQLEVGNINKKYPEENVSLGGAGDEKERQKETQTQL